MTDLTNTHLPALERLARERQGWKQLYPNALSWSPPDSGRLQMFPPFTADEYLSLLDGLPPSIQFEFGLDDQGEREIRVRDSDFLDRYLFGFTFDKRSDALKRAILIAYLEEGK